MVKVNADKLAVVIAESGLTQSELSRLSKIDQSRITRLLRTGGNVRTTTAFSLARALDRPPSDFLDAVVVPKKKGV